MQCSEKVIRGRIGSGRCAREAVADGYCRQHHPSAVQARRDVANAKARVESARRDVDFAVMQAGIAVEWWHAGRCSLDDLQTKAGRIREARAAYAVAIRALSEAQSAAMCGEGGR